MGQPSVAARRFYHAFYKWNKSSCSSALPAPRRNLVIPAVRSQHTKASRQTRAAKRDREAEEWQEKDRRPQGRAYWVHQNPRDPISQAHAQQSAGHITPAPVHRNGASTRITAPSSSIDNDDSPMKDCVRSLDCSDVELGNGLQVSARGSHISNRSTSSLQFADSCARPRLMILGADLTQSRRTCALSTSTIRGTHCERPRNERVSKFKVSQNPSMLTEDLKRALRPLTHPVALITSRVSGQAQDDPDTDDFRGVTVSSFNTVTMSATSIVSFNLRIPSRSWDAIHSSQRMTIHLLSATPEGAAVAHAFTQPYEQPGEPFRRLRSIGAVVSSSGHSRSGMRLLAPPRLSWDPAVIAQMDADLLLDKCVEIGDHIVVFAQVTSLALPFDPVSGEEDVLAVDRSEGLAYALRGFRGVGSKIEPVKLTESRGFRPGLSEHVVDEIDAGNLSAQGASIGASNDDAGIPSNDVEPESEPIEDAPMTPLSRSQTLGSARCSMLLSAPGASSHSPIGRQRRSHSILSSPDLGGAQAQRKVGYAARPLHDMVSDQALLSSTVDDFLGIPYRHTYKSRRIRGLIRLQTAVEEASQQLEQMLASGSLTLEESSRLENIITRNERTIAKTLALRSASDLQRMLDEGKVDFHGVQWIESSVERGQAVLLEEARELRKALDEHTIDARQFEQVKAKLEEDNNFMSTVLMRLRQLVDEESDDGVASKDGAKFDGFDGNM